MGQTGASPVMEKPRVALFTAEQAVAPAAQDSLSAGFNLTLLESPEQLPGAMARHLSALILDLDTVAETPRERLAVVQQIRESGPEVLLVVLTRSTSRKLRAAITAAGADEFFAAPVDFQEVRIVLQRALRKRRIEAEERRAREEILRKSSFCDLIGASQPMRRVYGAIGRVAESNSTVLLLGESGTGKELAARAMVAMSPRRDRPFISVNCAAIPETLVETELFGHEKGAFTGADVARAGHIELAHTGTLFLDEIATLSLALQSKFLRVLEDRAVTRVGSKAGRKIDFRLLCASNEDLKGLVHSGRFREDLFYRINVVPIVLPPLRERFGDIPLLVEHFLRMYCDVNRLPLKRVDPEALSMLEAYSWPGNVRELENLLQRMVLMVDGPLITARDLPEPILEASAAGHEALLIPADGINFDEEITRIKSAYLSAALKRAGGRKAAAARLLHIPPQKMKYLCRKFRLKN